MSCGVTNILSRIKLAWFVFKHPEWKCKPWCLTCEFYDNCLLEYEAEVGETIEGIPVEYERCAIGYDYDAFMNSPSCDQCPYKKEGCPHTWVSDSEVYY